jgi:hypothetical protein
MYVYVCVKWIWYDDDLLSNPSFLVAHPNIGSVGAWSRASTTRHGLGQFLLRASLNVVSYKCVNVITVYYCIIGYGIIYFMVLNHMAITYQSYNSYNYQF